MINKKKIIIIGAGIGQVHLVKLARSMEFYVIVVSPKGNYPAIDIADELFECDIYDYDKIVNFARENGVVAVTSDQNDLMVPTVAYVAEHLNLPGITYEQALSYCDKNKFRSICDHLNVPVPQHVAIQTLNIPKSFDCAKPWVVKPSDSQSSIGVSVISCEEDVYPAIENALCKSKCHSAILEQYFYGDEYVCEGFVYKGEYYNLAFGDRRYFKGTLIPSQTIFPSQIDENVKNKIINCEKKVSKYINPPFGIVHSEYLVNRENGEFCVVESAIRGGGVYISSHLIPLATGIDVNKLLLKCAVGDIDECEVKDCLNKKQNKTSAYICFTLPEGEIVEVSGIDKVKSIVGVEMCDIRNVVVGGHTEVMTAKGMRKGPILVCVNNLSEYEKLFGIIKETIKIRVKSASNEIRDAIWD